MSKDLRSSENFVVFGTAFPEPTEKDRRAGRTDAGQFVPVWKQEARDEKGRRRFHGAFTGGFSAGYFNTVGSKEGWEPSNFVSSRSARTERKEAKPEDYMDEEDLEAMAGARKLVATEEFDILGGTERELAARRKLEAESGDILGSSLMSMFGPPKDSIGIRLLRKMGWRPGQGIGPRIKRSLDDQSDDEETDITFAPHDTPIENFSAKRDNYGLGYDLASSVPQVAEMKRLREIARQEALQDDDNNRSSFGVKGGGAFGLGAFDENDEDDDDIYGGSEPILKNYHRALYDENEGGYTRDELKAQALKRKELEKVEQENKIKCSDGRPPIRGFIVSNKNQQIGKWHAPPKVPADFTAQHIFKENDTPKAAEINKESIFSFEERGNVLGEKPIEARSVFDYMPKHSKDKLDQAISFFIDIGKDKSQLSDFPTIPKDVAKLALQGFIPFGDNPKKQARYKNYLENFSGQLTEDGEPIKVLPIPEGLSYEAGMKELDEFSKAARIFRPLSAMMSDRFTSSNESKNIEVLSFEGGLKTEQQYREEKEAIAKSITPEVKKQLSQEQEAAAMKMFGNLTRTVKPFYPSRLLCKRFNVRDPHPDHKPTAPSDVGRSEAGSKDVLSKESMESMLNQRLPLKFTPSEETIQDDPALNAVIPKPSDRASNETAPITGIEKEMVKEEEEEETELDYERPSMDIFKAIFDDSDEEEEEEETETATTVVSNVVEEEDEFIGPPPPETSNVDIPIERNTPVESSEPFRPMFKRASERKENITPLANVVSEEVVVQPFTPRINVHKRRHVSLSDEDDDDEEEEETGSEEDKKRSERSRSKRHKSSRHHKSSKSSKRSRSRERRHKSSRHDHKSSRSDDKKRHKSSRKRSRSPDEERRHKSSRKRSRSSDDRKHRHSKSHKSSHYSEDDEYEGLWVEKEPVIPLEPTKKTEGRKKAVDLW